MKEGITTKREVNLNISSFVLFVSNDICAGRETLRRGTQNEMRRALRRNARDARRRTQDAGRETRDAIGGGD